MSMIERVARAICWRATKTAASTNPLRHEGLVDQFWPNHVETARAAIEAMREPTPEMLREPDQLAVIGSCLPSASEATELWQAMIDKALEE